MASSTTRTISSTTTSMLWEAPTAAPFANATTCGINSLPPDSELNLTGISDLVCGTDILPKTFDITPCCASSTTARVKDNCIQYCQGSDFNDFDNCIQKRAEDLNVSTYPSLTVYCHALFEDNSPLTTKTSSTTATPKPTAQTTSSTPSNAGLRLSTRSSTVFSVWSLVALCGGISLGAGFDL